MTDSFDLKKFLIENRLTPNSRSSVYTNGTFSKNLTSILEGRQVSTHSFNTGLNEESEFINQLLQENNLQKVQEYVQGKFIAPLVTLLDKILQNISKVSKSIVDGSLRVLKGILKLVSRFRDKYPTIFKAILITVLFVVISLTVGVVSAYAAAGGDLSALQQAATDGSLGSDGVLQTVYGFLSDPALTSGIPSGLMMETKGLVLDLMDGKVDIKDFSKDAKTVSDAMYTFYRELSSEGDSQALKLLNNAFEKGSELIQQTTIRLGNVKINPDGTIG